MGPRAKIICTLGPASDSMTILRHMMRSGMDVVRLNFSHGSHKDHAGRIAAVRRLNQKYRRHIRILQDLEGYRIRIGRLKAPVPLKKRQTVLLSNLPKTASACVLPFDYEGSLTDIRRDSLIYIDDGQMALRVKEVTRRFLKTEVIIPGIVRERKGINIPGVRLAFKGLTAKDRRDIAFGISHRVDFIAQSFVRDARDIRHVREALAGCQECKIIAKIENEEGIRNIDGILDVTDGIMIARGDLGVSMPIYEVPVWQKRIIKKCKQRRRFVITATQMLESMTEHLRPTRAEVSDVANAVLDGSDYVMLSGETAAGRYPVETVKMMNQIIKFTEDAHL